MVERLGMKLMVLETRRVTLALILKGEDSLHCRGDHNPEELSCGSVTSGIYSMSQTSCGMEDHNTFLFHPLSFIRRRNSRVPWSFRETRAAMYSLGRVSVCLLEMGLLGPGVVLTLFIARYSLGTLFSSFLNSSERVTMILFILWMKKPKPPRV